MISYTGGVSAGHIFDGSEVEQKSSTLAKSERPFPLQVEWGGVL